MSSWLGWRSPAREDDRMPSDLSAIHVDADEVTRAFRAQAKRSHPDASPGAAAAQRFSDVTAAYAVLGDHRTRLEYDRVRAEALGPVAVPASSTPAAAPKATSKPWSRRR